MTGSDASADTTTTQAPDPTPDPAAVPELPSDFDQAPTAAPPATAPADEAPLDAAAPPISQAGHTESRAGRPALWATGAAFGGLLLVSAAWLWTRRRRYDPA